MVYSTSNTLSLQPLLFDSQDFSSCFFRKPSERELEFLSLYDTIQQLLSPRERMGLRRACKKGRVGYDLLPILGIMLLKLHFRQPTMKETLLLLQENGNLRDILGISNVPSQASVSRLSRDVESIVDPAVLHERVIQAYQEGMDNRMVGHLSIDSTIIEAREKPFVKKKEKKVSSPKKKGRKKKGSPEEKEYRKQKSREEQKRLEYLAEEILTSISRLEIRCSLTAKQNSKGMKQWSIGYKAHLAADDFGLRRNRGLRPRLQGCSPSHEDGIPTHRFLLRPHG